MRSKFILLERDSRSRTYLRCPSYLRSRFHQFLESAYIHANKTLLKMLVEEQDLQSHLRCVASLSLTTPFFSLP